MTFSGKTVLITGASRGIGRATAIAFANEGARVALHLRNEQSLSKENCNFLQNQGHTTVQADLADPVAVQRMVEDAIARLGHIDILVNNAGLYENHPLDQTQYDDWQTVWQRILAVNLTGAANVTYCVAQHMMSRRQGRIINVSSRGAFRGEPTAPAYGASKAGLNALSQSLAIHLAPYNIGVMVVAPGWVETDMARPTLESEAGEAIRRQSPLHRVARPEEVAATILFLASEAAEFLTGSIVDVNGASYLRS